MTYQEITYVALSHLLAQDETKWQACFFLEPRLGFHPQFWLVLVLGYLFLLLLVLYW